MRPIPQPRYQPVDSVRGAGAHGTNFSEFRTHPIKRLAGGPIIGSYSGSGFLLATLPDRCGYRQRSVWPCVGCVQISTPESHLRSPFHRGESVRRPSFLHKPPRSQTSPNFRLPVPLISSRPFARLAFGARSTPHHQNHRHHRRAFGCSLSSFSSWAQLWRATPSIAGADDVSHIARVHVRLGCACAP